MGKEKKNDNWWVWILIITGAIFLFSFIQEKQSDKELEDTVRNADPSILFQTIFSRAFRCLRR